MPDVTYGDHTPETSPTTTHIIPAEKGGVTVSLTPEQINSFLRTELKGGVSTTWDTLKKLADGKLSIDGALAMLADLDMGGNSIVNLAALQSDFDMGGNRITGLGFPGILVETPELVFVSGTFNYDPYCKTAWVFGQGSGGAGGGASSATGQCSFGSGGAGGSFFWQIVDVSALSTKSATLTVGAGGTGVSGANGSAGGNTVYVDEGQTITIPGAAGGITGIQSGIGYGEKYDTPTTGISSSAFLKRVGFPGSGGTGISITSGIYSVKSGSGGNSVFGTGGWGQGLGPSGAANNAAANNGLGYGGGGGGAVSVLNPGALAGGNGAPGCFLILQFM